MSIISKHNHLVLVVVLFSEAILKGAGFDINSPVKVRVMDDCLVLTTPEQKED